MKRHNRNLAIVFLLLGIAAVSNAQVLRAGQATSAGDGLGSRGAILQRVGQQAPDAVLDQEGRTTLAVGTFLLSLGFYGYAVPTALGVDNQRHVLGLYMLTSAAGLLVPLSATRDGAVTDAEASLSLYGGTRGIAHGALVYGLLTGKVSERELGRGVPRLTTLTSLGEIISGVHVARSLGMSAGTAEAIAAGGDFGIGFGVGAAHLAGFLDDDGSVRPASGAILIGSGVGLLAGKWLADQQSYTRGDAWVLRTTNAVGAYAPLALVDMFEPEENRAYTAAAMGGGVLGVGVGHYLTRRRDFTTGQGLLITSGAAAGGLLGAGLAYVVSSDDADNRTRYLAASALGATVGLWLGYRAFADDARTSTDADGYASAPPSRWTISFPSRGF